ncbi:MAG: stage V sporulation protein AD [Firmicutes bacterium]|nr:stage V sporulation protein AD [Bacillota bacterium]
MKKTKRVGQTLIFHNNPKIISGASVVAKRESEGPIGLFFDEISDNCKQDKKCFEKSEIRMMTRSIELALNKTNLRLDDIDMFLAGDLLNQITTSSFVSRELSLPFLGLYSACSTFTESLALGAMMIDSGFYDNILCSTSSHFATAERQYRFPLEFGNQRPPYAQWTVTGSGSTILSNKSNDIYDENIFITSATIGRVVDFGIKDISNMGAAMAPAALSTLMSLFKNTNTTPTDYDLIATGDLGKLGSDILRQLMNEQNYDLGQNYTDCGNLIYNVHQKCYQGGSGAGCSAAVFNSFLLQRLRDGKYKKIILAATGALMSSQTSYQGESIPGICHAVVIERK